MLKNLKIISPIAFIISLFLIIYFKPIPNGKLWSNYSVLYVNVEQDDSIILQTLDQSNIKDYVCLSKQFLPLTISSNSVEFSMFRLIFSDDEEQYHNKRNNYFFDKSKQFRLYYVPNHYKKQLTNAVSLLNKKNIHCGVDTSSQYPWILPIVGLLLIIILSLFSKKRALFLLLSAPIYIFLYCNPFYPVAIALSLQILMTFAISNIWKRKNFLLYLAKNKIVQGLLIISLLCAFSSSIKTGFLFFCMLICVTSVAIFYFLIENYIRQKKSFIPVYIKSARMVNVFAKKTKFVLLIVISATVLLFGSFFLSSNESYNSHFAKLLLPSNCTFQDSKLTQLEDYYKWTWDIKTAPYKSLNKNENTTLLEYPKYEEDENGLIRETKVVMAYNQNFKENTFNDISNLQFNAIEKVLKSEGSSFIGGYKSSSSYKTTFFGIIMCFICFFVLLFIYFSIIIKKGTKNEIS